MHRVLKISTENAFCLHSKERVPFHIIIEVVYDQDQKVDDDNQLPDTSLVGHENPMTERGPAGHKKIEAIVSKMGDKFKTLAQEVKEGVKDLPNKVKKKGRGRHNSIELEDIKKTRSKSVKNNKYSNIRKTDETGEKENPFQVNNVTAQINLPKKKFFAERGSGSKNTNSMYMLDMMENQEGLEENLMVEGVPEQKPKRKSD